MVDCSCFFWQITRDSEPKSVVNIESVTNSLLVIPSRIYVQYNFYVTGEADFIIIVTAKDMEDFDAFTKQMFFADSNVLHFKTSVVMERTKVSLALPLV